MLQLLPLAFAAQLHELLHGLLESRHHPGGVGPYPLGGQTDRCELLVEPVLVVVIVRSKLGHVIITSKTIATR